MRNRSILVALGFVCWVASCDGDSDGPGASGSSGSAGSAGSGGAAGVGGTGGGGAGGTGGTSPQAGGSVLQHHNHASRDGVYVDAMLTRTAVANLRIDSTFNSPTIQGAMYAQPLYLAGTAGKPDLVIVATEQNRVYGLNAATGAQVWQQTVGTPTPRGDCGNIDPMGVTGTPVIDEGSRTLYLSAMTYVSNVANHVVQALNADTGVPRPNWSAGLNGVTSNTGTTFVSRPHNQRGALALVGGWVFVPFGGHAGDCGPYRGWVIGVSTSDSTQVRVWSVGSVAGGIWAPSGIASDGTSLFVATGNTQKNENAFNPPPDTWSGGEALLKFPLTLAFSGQNNDYYSPTNWKQLDIDDADLGGTAPVLFNLGSTGYAMALGKDGNAYLVARNSMGGISEPLVKRQVAGGAIINAAAAYTTPQGTYVVFRGRGSGCPGGTSGGVTALKVAPGNPPTISVAWCAGPQSQHSPAVSVVNSQGNDAIVWIVGTDNKLYGLNGDTGATLYDGGSTAMSGVRKFQTPIVSKGRLFVAADGRVYAFALP
jgi:outer membrane protein assembly factor BamB